MNNLDHTALNVSRYVGVNASTPFGAEHVLLDQILKPGMVVADAGCGEGRLTRYLERKGVRVVAFDLNMSKLRQLAQSVDPSRVHVVAMDLRSLGLGRATVDAFILAFNVIDFLFPEGIRRAAMTQIIETLKPGGYLLLSSHNPVGTLLSPRGLASPRNMLWRMTYLLSGDLAKPYFRDPNRLLLYQTTPRRLIRQVTDGTGMRFVLALDKSGRMSNLPLLGLFSSWPYYLFARDADPCC